MHEGGGDVNCDPMKAFAYASLDALPGRYEPLFAKAGSRS